MHQGVIEPVRIARGERGWAHLAGDGELVADLTLACAELAVKLGDGTRLDAACRTRARLVRIEQDEARGLQLAAEDVVEGVRARRDGDELGAAGVAGCAGVSERTGINVKRL